MSPVPDAYTVSLLHLNGADASTSFTDESGKTWTPNGNAQIDTAQSKFGGASGLFDGTGDWIDTPDHADFDFGSGDFTIDFQIRTNTVGVDTDTLVLGQGLNGTFPNYSIICQLRQYAGGNGYIKWFLNVGGVSVIHETSTSLFSASTWTHIALSRSGTNFYAFSNGVLCSSSSDSGSLLNSSNKFAIGRMGEYAGNYFNGHIDEIRISKGIARWTSAFTPPAYEYGIELPKIIMIGE